MIILLSSGTGVMKHLTQQYLKEKDIKRILFIDTAAESETGDDPQWLIDEINAIKAEGYEVDRWSITNKSSQEIEEKIDACDAIYMNGGNTFYLLEQMQKSSCIELIRDKVINEGKIYIGSSAGSIVAAADISPTKRLDDDLETPDLENTSGLNIVDHLVLPHWGSNSFRDVYLSDRIKEVYNDNNHRYVLLSDNQYIVVNKEGWSKIIDITK